MKIQKEKMKEWLIGLCVAGTLFCSCSDKSGEVIPTDYVNPLLERVQIFKLQEHITG